MRLNKLTLALPLVLLLATGCSESDDDNIDGNADNGAEEMSAQIQFAARVNGEAFTENTAYNNIGIGNTAYKPEDLRFFVSNVSLKTDSGAVIPVTLTEDGAWQYNNTTLIDFETGKTPETNINVVGTYEAPASGEIDEVCFEVGIPFAENHLDSATSPSPLNATGMMWAWQSGHKFIRLDGKVDPDGTNTDYFIHLGSTGCSSDGKTEAPESACTYPNVPAVCLDNFDMDTQAVTMDIGKLLAGTDLTQSRTAIDGGDPHAQDKPGCMSFHPDPQCAEIMPKMGLGFEFNNGSSSSSTPAETQSFFELTSK